MRVVSISIKNLRKKSLKYLQDRSSKLYKEKRKVELAMSRARTRSKERDSLRKKYMKLNEEFHKAHMTLIQKQKVMRKKENKIVKRDLGELFT